MANKYELVALEDFIPASHYDKAVECYEEIERMKKPENADEAERFVFKKLENGLDEDWAYGMMLEFRDLISLRYWKDRVPPKSTFIYNRRKYMDKDTYMEWLTHIFLFFCGKFKDQKQSATFGLKLDKYRSLKGSHANGNPLKLLASQYSNYAFRQFGREFIDQDVREEKELPASTFDDGDSDKGLTVYDKAASVETNDAEMIEAAECLDEMSRDETLTTPLGREATRAEKNPNNWTPFQVFIAMLYEPDVGDLVAVSKKMNITHILAVRAFELIGDFLKSNYGNASVVQSMITYAKSHDLKKEYLK